MRQSLRARFWGLWTRLFCTAFHRRPDGVHPRLEKYILRKAFDDTKRPYLPENVLWRQKEQFSDGVGYDWVDGVC